MASMRRSEELGPFDLLPSQGSPRHGPISPHRQGRLSHQHSPYRHPECPRSSGPSNHYAFPSPTGSPVHSPTSPTSIKHPQTIHQSRNPIRSRRPSPLLHEIQPPCRRLSSHQMLLLTPFGGPLPAGAITQDQSSLMDRGQSSMRRGSSSMGRSHPPPVSMAPNPTRHSQFPRPRGRHQSLGLPPPIAGPSPLAASTPMTTIPSASESSSGGSSSVPQSRQVSNNSDVEMEDELPALLAWTPRTVPMARSNSLPVLTLRELQALQDKDGALGIARGGGWAWVAREDEVIEESSPSTTNNSLTPPAFPFTAFNDPFAPKSSRSNTPIHPFPPSLSSSMPRDPAYLLSRHEPVATMAGYHYSPKYNEARRMSEAPSLSSLAPSSPASTIGRRPSAPVSTYTHRQSTYTQRGVPTPLSLSPGESPRGSTELGSSPKSRVESSNSAQRPKITRYKSLPGRNEGLGLQIVVRPSERASSPNTALSTGKPSHRGSMGSIISGRGSISSRRGSARKRLSGSWASIDVVDSLALSDLSMDGTGQSTTSTLSSARESFASTSANSGMTSMNDTPSPLSTPAPLFFVEEIASRAHLSEFGTIEDGSSGSMSIGKGKNKVKVQSDDEMFSSGNSKYDDQGGLGGGVGYVAQLAQAGWNATFPRRGSLAMLTRAVGPWAVSELGGLGGLGGIGGGGVGVGDKDRIGVSGVGAKHWSERRGSWAEGWTKS